MNLPADSTFSSLLQSVIDPHRELVKALVDEINQCLRRVQQRARQNHMLLSWSLEMMQRFMAMLFPSSMVTTYNQSGKAQAVQAARPGLCEVMG